MLFAEVQVAFVFSGKRFGGCVGREQVTNGLISYVKDLGLYPEKSDESGKGCKKGNGMILFGLQRCLW